jgi:hypothetical protein
MRLLRSGMRSLMSEHGIRERYCTNFLRHAVNPSLGLGAEVSDQRLPASDGLQKLVQHRSLASSHSSRLHCVGG